MPVARATTRSTFDLFMAFFNRPADAGGAGFWTDQLDAGAPPRHGAPSVRAVRKARATRACGVGRHMQDVYLVTMRRCATLYEIWSRANGSTPGRRRTPGCCTSSHRRSSSAIAPPR